MKSPCMMLSLFTAVTLMFFACGDAQNDQRAPSEDANMSVEEKPLWVSYTGNPAIKKDKTIILVSGDEEYRSEEALPQLGRILADHHGFNCTVLFAQDPALPGLIDPNYLNNIPGLDMLESADLMIIFTRFRELPDDQMQHIDHYLMHGKPVLGIRTATHAFNIKDSTSMWRRYGNFYEGDQTEWEGGFGRLVLGERWYSHHGNHKHQSTVGKIAPTATAHPVVRGLKDDDIWGSTDVYGVRLPLPGDSEPLILGQVMDRTGDYDEDDLHFGLRPTDQHVATESGKDKYNPNDPMMPIVWTKSYQLPGGMSGRSVTSTIGAAADLTNMGVRRVLVNASYWLLDLEVPAETKVDLVGEYTPSAYSFHREEGYWQKKNLQVSDY